MSKEAAIAENASELRGAIDNKWGEAIVRIVDHVITNPASNKLTSIVGGC